MYQPQQSKARKLEERHPTTLGREQGGLTHGRVVGKVAQGANGYTQYANKPPIVQPKLLLGSSGDAFEQEADRVAQRVGAGESAQAALTLRGPAGGAHAITPEVEQGIQGARGSGQPLAAGLRTTMEGALGADLGAVRLHTDTRADSLNQALQARAFTTGPDIFFRRGGYAPGSAAGQQLLAHELTHVVQQGAAPALAEGAPGGGSVGGTAVVQRNDDDEAPLVQNNVEINAPPQLGGDEYGLEPIINELVNDIEQEDIVDELIEEMNEEQLARTQQDQALDALPDTPEEAASYKDWAELKAMTLKQLDGYAQTQADWHVSTSLSDEERKQVWMILAFARQDAILAGSGQFKVEEVDQLLQDKGEKVAFAALTEYSVVVKSQQPFDLKAADQATVAFAQGVDLKKLRAAMGDVVLKAGVNGHTFKLLSRYNRTDDLISYYTTSKPTPIFQAHGGRDLLSYLIMRVDENQDPLDYSKGVLKGKVRNYHRFEKAALDKLEDNYKDTSKKKPLTLILHSGLDHGGAFHRDPNLTAVIANTKILTLMIEGKETLADLQGELGPLATTYGMNDGIDQIMFAGHGGSRAMELAGKVEEQGDQLKEVHDYLGLDDPIQKGKSDALFQELLKYLDKEGDIDNLQPHQRALFNACLTNANIYGGKPLSWKPDEARKQIKEYLAQNASFATYFQTFADKEKAKITSLGANASIRKVGLIDPKDNLDMISKEDPFVTASKLTYVEKGTEPGGVIYAVLELWSSDQASDQNALGQAMSSRVKLGASTDWHEAMIRSIFHYILTNAWQAAPIIHHLADVASTLTHLEVMENMGQPSQLHPLFVGNQLVEAITHWILEDVEKTDAWRDSDFLSLVLYQLWMGAKPNEASLRDKFLAKLDTLTCQRARKFVDVAALHPIMSTLLANPVKAGQITLALLDVLSETPANESNQFLIACTKNDVFPPNLKISDKLAGLATEDEILIAIGKKEKPNVNNAVVSANKPGNVAVGGSDKNTLAMLSVTKRGKIAPVEGANLYEKADRTSKVLKVLDQNDEVTIFASAGGWFAIEYKDGITMKSAFVNLASVTLL